MCFTPLLLPVEANAALPRRLVILLDGVSHRDVRALQQGIIKTDKKGRQYAQQAFHQGYFPVSRLVSTFPSASDVAWTEILGNRPLPGYQRTYLSAASGQLIRQNGITTSMEYELQMHWQVESGLRRALGYVTPHACFKHEVRELARAFMNADQGPKTYYAMIRASDDAQHTVGDIFVLLGILDAELQTLRASYRATEGRDLEVLILSDHGNNRAGAGQRVPVLSFLKRAGYNVTDRLRGPQDVVLPTVGIQNWVEVNCVTSQTVALAMLLADLEGVDVVTARLPGEVHQFLVMNADRERALIEWNPANDSYRYVVQQGDPLDYGPVIADLIRQRQMDADGFAPGHAWLTGTMAHRYPVALERIARAHTQNALNPSSILISLKNGYVHSSWLLKRFSALMRMGGTHGALDALCSNGIVLSSFQATEDTTTRHVAEQFNGFDDLKDPRTGQMGAGWFYPELRALASTAHTLVGLFHPRSSEHKPLLQMWTPVFSNLEMEAPVEVTVKLTRRFLTPRVRRSDPLPEPGFERRVTLRKPLKLPNQYDFERVYALPEGLTFEPLKSYRISGRIREIGRGGRIFDFTFQTDTYGLPVVQ